ncbi:MAG: amidohydrolase family protein [Phycisphaerales bacterium]|nr:MAG: amidohydrolase family protein [Phycisphaerales bacterium]
MTHQTLNTGQAKTNPANRLGLDYAAEAARFADLPFAAVANPGVGNVGVANAGVANAGGTEVGGAIIDAHVHVNGLQATKVYRKVADLYGIGLTYSMTKLEEVQAVTEAMEGRVRFIAVPNYWAQDDRKYHMTDGFVKRIEQYHALGSRIAKFWCSPRATEYAIEFGDPDLLRLDAPHRIHAMEAATDLGMILMTHVADPDTWFDTRFADASVFGTKAQQYEPFEQLLDRFTQPWLAAHMGGWPEDLEFLTGLMNRHPNLYLDTSATKWMVRELSRHSRNDLISFLCAFKGRILFGSDIVVADEHLRPPADGEHEVYSRANGPDQAFELYASRYWALRTMFETEYSGESPIADPDLAMVEPDKYTELDAPTLIGRSLPPDLLRSIYRDAAHDLLEPLHEKR